MFKIISYLINHLSTISSQLTISLLKYIGSHSSQISKNGKSYTEIETWLTHYEKDYDEWKS